MSDTPRAATVTPGRPRPTTLADRVAALGEVGLDEAAAVRALELLGEDVTGYTPRYRLEVTLEGRELASILDARRAAVAERAGGGIHDTAAGRLDLPEAVDDVAGGLIIAVDDDLATSPIGAVALAHPHARAALERLGLTPDEAAAVADRIEFVTVRARAA